ncbi:MAG: TerC family protein [Gammaproteobacteria bacterium]|jgi:predicted tellurium resistance membrane protein TerC
MEWISSPDAWAALTTLTLLEIVLGIDNIVFISILVGRLPEAQRQRARVIGLGLAMGMRILLLLLITLIMRLQAPLFTVWTAAISGRDLILLGGGLFLIAKATLEIHDALEGPEQHHEHAAAAGFIATIVQIGLIDIVFSLDSVITAVGMAEHIPVMIIAIVLAVGVMMLSAKAIGDFVDDHPTVKMLALSFLVLIGVALIGEGLDLHIPKGYIYFAMAFSIVVEVLNLAVRRRRKPVVLHKREL